MGHDFVELSQPSARGRRSGAGRWFSHSCSGFLLDLKAEISRIWSPARIEDWLADTARRSSCHVVGKIGSDGSLLAEAGTGRIIHVPALDVEVADTTGAGDAYCGGFLAGLAAGRPLRDCGVMATVSASFVVEAFGALATGRPSAKERDARFDRALSQTENICVR